MEQVVFAQVSDPHFAAERITDQPVRALGQNGHDLLLCGWLPAALEHFRQRTEFPANKVPVVMSGDLTRTGLDPGEFDVGFEYFEGVWPNPSGLPTRDFGLGLGKRRVLQVPGNHDHWDGDVRNQWGYNAAIKGRHFPDFRKALSPLSLRSASGRLIVEFYGVDSGSGFPPLGVGSNPRARGSIHDDELNKLTQLLNGSAGKRANDEANGIHRVRVIVCHHSFQGNWLLSWFFGSLELDTRSQDALKHLAGRYQVAAILTGHAHDFLADRYATSEPGHWLREFRSPTTLQAVARRFKQGFYGHRIVVNDAGRTWWSAYPYVWQGSYFYPPAIDEEVPLPGEWNPLYFQVT